MTNRTKQRQFSAIAKRLAFTVLQGHCCPFGVAEPQKRARP